MLVFNFNIKLAISSKTLIQFGCLFYRYLSAIDKKNEIRKYKPIIDYQIAAIFCPFIYLGSMFGVLLY